MNDQTSIGRLLCLQSGTPSQGPDPRWKHLDGPSLGRATQGEERARNALLRPASKSTSVEEEEKIGIERRVTLVGHWSGGRRVDLHLYAHGWFRNGCKRPLRKPCQEISAGYVSGERQKTEKPRHFLRSRNCSNICMTSSCSSMTSSPPGRLDASSLACDMAFL